MIRTLLLSILFIATISPSAQEEVEIDGLVIDQSISRFGHQFYFQFSQLWRDVPNTAGINITVKETVLPRAGTRLEVLMNSRAVYATAMGRRGGSIDERVETAIFTIMDAMARAQYQQNGSEDLAASGW
ncbi:curli production assembly/transport protein CsgE [Pseudoalteromonas piscicida]|uniref:curli production assembly/transport protein CsgE n=1 Tax=Pseudoalteromonas piscicida TaxID=43662 RepID=UPI001F5B2E2F|nr:curli production assembly/transport protein CsgE [Pseudoalteromonas piscicida]